MCIMAPKLKRARNGRPTRATGPNPRPTAINKLADHGILNGHGQKTHGLVQYYKNQGVPEAALRQSARYLLHTKAAERKYLWECLMNGDTTMNNVTKLIETYREERDFLARHHEREIRRRYSTIEIDSTGVLH